MSIDPDERIMVLERTREDYLWTRRGIERTFAEICKGEGLARWLADPKSGRFLILNLLETDFDQIVTNVDTQEELLGILSGVLESHRDPAQALNLDVYVSPEIEAAIRAIG